MLNERYYNTKALTDDIVRDRFMWFDYKPLSRKEELSLIKKLKLSYYDEVDDNLKELYLNYYFEEFPEFKNQYEKSNEKEKLLEEAIENATDYRDYFLNNNSRLVFSMVKRIFGINNKFEDLFQEGTIGMMRALEKFDISGKNRFSTYATWWIRQSVIRYQHNNSRKIRVPVHISEKIYSIKKCRESLEVKLGREPSNEEIAKEVNIDLAELERILLLNYYSQPISLDEPLHEDEEITLGNLLSDGTNFTNTVDNKISYQILIEALNNLDLDEKQRKIINMHYGLNEDKPYTYKEIAKELNITQERIKKIEQKILNRLRYKQDIVELYDSENKRVSYYRVKTLNKGFHS